MSSDGGRGSAYRLSHCPRCSREATGIRTKPYPKTNTPMSPDPPDPSDPSDSDFEIEEWVIYQPCGCEIPPEEHEDRLRDANRQK